MCKYYLDCKTTCKTTCNVRRVPTYRQAPARSYYTSEVTLWEDADEKKLYCPYSGRTRIVKKYNPCRNCPFANYKAPKQDKVYLIIL